MLGFYVLIKPYLRWMGKPTLEPFVWFLLIPFEEWDCGRIFPTWVMKRLCSAEVIGRERPVFYLCGAVGLRYTYSWPVHCGGFLSEVILFKCKVSLIFVIHINEYLERYHFTCSFLLCWNEVLKITVVRELCGLYNVLCMSKCLLAGFFY